MPAKRGRPTPTVICRLALDRQDLSPLTCSWGEDHGLTTANDRGMAIGVGGGATAPIHLASRPICSGPLVPVEVRTLGKPSFAAKLV